MARISRRKVLATGLSAVAAGVALPRSPAQGLPSRDRSHAHPHAIRHRMIRTNGIAMHVAEAGEGPTVLLLHGFPELWYSWRHQLPALARAGFHAVAPDLRGYGGTDAPAEAASYSMRNQLADLTGLLDALGSRTAAVVGHDLGAGIAWAAAQIHPDRFPAVVALGAPYKERTPIPLTELIRQNNPGMFNVVLYFQEPGVAEAELDADPARTLRMTMYALSGQAPPELVERWLIGTPEGSGFLDPLPDPGPPSRWSDWFTNQELNYYVRKFARTGFAGAMGRYRAFDFDWSDLPEEGTLLVTQPALFVAGELDSAYRFSSLEPMQEMVPGLRGITVLPGCGHWTQQERADEVNLRLVDFLHRDYASA